MTNTDYPAEFIEFVQRIQELWPSYKSTKEQILAVSRWSKWLKHMPFAAIDTALTDARSNDPCALRPDWKMIVTRLVTRNQQANAEDETPEEWHRRNREVQARRRARLDQLDDSAFEELRQRAFDSMAAIHHEIMSKEPARENTYLAFIMCDLLDCRNEFVAPVDKQVSLFRDV